jgi:excisionase family DNA binding protein
MSSDLLSTNEAAEMLNVGASTVKRWADEGRLQCVKTAGGHRRFRRSVVAEMLNGSSSDEMEISATQIIEDIDGHATLALLYQLRSRYGAWWVVAEQVASFLHHVGEDWINGKMSIVEEHAISERLLRAIAAVCQALPTATSARTCLFVMVEGDDHTLGLRLAELVAQEAGWRSRWVGRNTPLTELPDLLASQTIQSVAASASAF